MSNLALKEVIAALKDIKNDWREDSYTISCGKLKIWTANVPILDTNVYEPCELQLSLFEKYKLYQAVKVARQNMVLRITNSLTGVENEKTSAMLEARKK